MATPTLNPPCPGWQEDLPGPYAQPIHKPGLGFKEFNHMDAVYFEFSRSLLALRGLSFWVGAILFACMAAYIVLRIKYSHLISEVNFSKNHPFIELIGITIILTNLWGSLFMIKSDIAPPIDLPIRFNRARQRIYAYNYKWCWWNPFERWRVTPVAYDWSQVRAERWSRRAVGMHGAILKWGVELAIVKPGTNEVIDRFPLSTMSADQHAWAYICWYMQQGPSTLPRPEHPHDPNDFWEFNIAKRLAPKVKWPADMDVESRTAAHHSE